MRLVYALCQKNYFTQGPRGRVSHACGFSQGLIKNGVEVTLLSGPGGEDYIPGGVKYISVGEKNRVFWWFFYILRLCIKAVNADSVVIRWRPALPFVFLPMLVLFRKKGWFEINSITGIDSKNRFKRFIVRLSIYISAKNFRSIVVSNEAKNTVVSLCRGHRQICVVPNGFNGEAFESVSQNFQENAESTLVYFGRKQSYYDWEMLESIFKYEKPELYDGPSCCIIFGFNGTDGLRIKYKGEFDHKSLVKSLNNLQNPIFLLHASDSNVARSGSPMKLFECAALGYPVVLSSSLASQAKGFKSFVRYEAGNRQAFIDALYYAHSNYEDLFCRAASTRVIAYQKYSWEAVVLCWLTAVWQSEKV